MNPKLEHHVPLTPSVRPGKENSKRSFLRSMPPGSSFELPEKEMSPWAAAACKLPKGSFTIRRQSNGLHRCWKLPVPVPPTETTSRVAKIRALPIGGTLHIGTGQREGIYWHSAANNAGMKVSLKRGILTRLL